MMQVGVLGLWHLGSVTAACLAAAGHEVTGCDPDATTIEHLDRGQAPLFEPGLDALLQAGLARGKLRFLPDPATAFAEVDLLWVTFDTPVDEDDRADTAMVETQIQSVLADLRDGTVVLVSSQLPVGTIKRLEEFARRTLPDKKLDFACSPENLRLGKAIEVFNCSDRIVVGVRSARARDIIGRLLAPISDRIEWMSVESAEMTKHAINAFLALSVTFANEIATLCELAGADAKQVERGLKSESRIGPKAYLAPGGPFAGGTLARDIEFLGQMSREHGVRSPLLASVQQSNDAHKRWTTNKLVERLGALDGRCIAIWGLTYKPGTDTLRRSLAVDLCDWLLTQGATVRVFDPVVQSLPPHWDLRVVRCAGALDALDGAQAMVVGTEWPEFRERAAELAKRPTQVAENLVVIDPNRHLEAPLRESGFGYFAVGSLTTDDK